MDTEVSIITCLYNAEKYIKDTAKSVSEQTFKNFEWLIVDDCSTDSSRAILGEMAALDNRITIFFLKKNKGPIYARNYAIERAKGRFIAFLDSDDIWLPEKLEKQIAFMKEKKAPLSYTGYKKIFDCNKTKIGISIPVPARISYNQLLYSNSIMASSAIYDTEITGSIRQAYEIPIGKDDYYFFLSILKKHGYAYGLKEDLARLRIHHDSITRNKLKAIEFQWYFYRNIIKLSRAKSITRFIIYAIKGFLKYLI